ncbi:hypothetical protein IC232_04970 [Microvirga sp. BT688]|uniref:hypothetical protein n=1 Tax=Microvirga sp. TaxID=1873136 RepID=UPI0016860480|nr:hypothetical protein [Microvirga sp.]MBD2746049.1 hypothetical protein [Microvirga sp.]
MARQSAFRAQRSDITWHKGRRPRRRIRSSQAKAGVRALRRLVWLLLGAMAVFMVLSFQGIGQGTRPAPSSRAFLDRARSTSTPSRSPAAAGASQNQGLADISGAQMP